MRLSRDGALGRASTFTTHQLGQYGVDFVRQSEREESVAQTWNKSPGPANGNKVCIQHCTNFKAAARSASFHTVTGPAGSHLLLAADEFLFPIRRTGTFVIAARLGDVVNPVDDRADTALAFIVSGRCTTNLKSPSTSPAGRLELYGSRTRPPDPYAGSATLRQQRHIALLYVSRIGFLFPATDAYR